MLVQISFLAKLLSAHDASMLLLLQMDESDVNASIGLPFEDVLADTAQPLVVSEGVHGAVDVAGIQRRQRARARRCRCCRDPASQAANT